MESNYFSKEDQDSLEIMHEDFIGNGRTVWFIEHEKTNFWMMDSGQFTTDPNKAMQFKAKMIAISEKVKRNLHKGYIVTEHEFVLNSTNKPS